MISPDKSHANGSDQHLQVLADATGARRWWPMVTGIARLVDLRPKLAVLPDEQGADDAVQRVLTAARIAGGPVLLLPLLPPGVAAPRPGTRPIRLLVPVDGSTVEGSTLRPFIHRAQDRGAVVDQIHVLGPATRPVMWDGAGHHASAFLSELRQRLQIGPSHLDIAGGDPASAIADAAPGYDVVVLSWQAGDLAGRAPVVRALVDQMQQPLLLIPYPATGDRPARRLDSTAQPPR
jgi:hypothetical protein